MISELDLLGAPEIPGSKCHNCGSTLLLLNNKPYCDWCDMSEQDEIGNALDELGLAENAHAKAVLEQLVYTVTDAAYDEGYQEADTSAYDDGYSDGLRSCGDE